MSEYVYIQKNYFLEGDMLTHAIFGISIGFNELLNKNRDENNKLSVGNSQFFHYIEGEEIINPFFEKLVNKYGPELEKAVGRDKRVSVFRVQTRGVKKYNEASKGLITVIESMPFNLSEPDLENLDTLMKGIQYERWRE